MKSTDLVIVSVTFLNSDVSRSNINSYDVYIAQVIRFARVSSRFYEFNIRTF